MVPSAISSSGYGLAVCLWSWRPRRRCYDIPPLLAGGSESEGPALQRGIWPSLFVVPPSPRRTSLSTEEFGGGGGGRSQTDGGGRSVEPRAAAVGRKGNGQTAPGIMYSREEEKDGILLPFFHCSSFTWSLRRRKEKEFVRRLRWLVVVWYFHLKEMESSIPSSLLSVFPWPSSFCFSSADCLSHGGDLSSLPLLLRVTNGDDSLPLPLQGASERTQKRILLPFLPLSSQSAVIAQPISLSLFSPPRRSSTGGKGVDRYVPSFEEASVEGLMVPCLLCPATRSENTPLTSPPPMPTSPLGYPPFFLALFSS